MKKDHPFVAAAGGRCSSCGATKAGHEEFRGTRTGRTSGKTPNKAADRSAGLSAFAPDAPFYNPVLQYENGRLVNSMGYPYVTLSNCSVAFAEELARRWNAYNAAHAVRPTPKEKA